MRPPRAPAAEPTAIDRASRRGAAGTMPWSRMEVTMPENTPRLIKPAWPRDSSPKMPTVRFRDTAITM